jgi:ubiquinone/menaquinone biosynthesis C-methylase UbiE
MNASHSPLTRWGLEHVVIGTDFVILDVGCGGGATVSRLADIASRGRVCGVDYSDGSVAVSRRKNAALIAAGRVDIRKASVSQLPFDAGTFDLVTAIETHYYWPNLPASMREIRRVLKPGGTLMILAESYRGSRFDALQRVVMKPLKSAHLSVDEHRELFTAAGYSDAQVNEHRGKGWICATGRVPALEEKSV